MTIIYFNRALRAIRDCDIIMPTFFTQELGPHKHVHRPGFSFMGTCYGKLRTFYIIEDQLFLVDDRGQHHMGGIAPMCLERLHALRRPLFEKEGK